MRAANQTDNTASDNTASDNTADGDTVRAASDPRSRVRRPTLRRRLATMGRRVRDAAGRRVWWLLSDPQRVLTLAWLVGVLIVGTANNASADIIVAPDLAKGAPLTLFESYDFSDYKLTVKPDDVAEGWFGISGAALEIIGFINNMIMWLCLGLLNGALALLAWFLNLTLYRDSAAQIDAATQIIATQVFWPLIAATIAVGAFIVYARWRNDGQGFLSDFGWIVAAAAIAVGFASAPSTIVGQVDGLRQDLAAGVMTGSSEYGHTVSNPTGFPTPDITGDPHATGTRKLIDTLWNNYGAIPWCYAHFRDIEICKVAGHHALANSEQWQQWMAELDDNGAPPEFGTNVHWIRGQDITRTGYLLVLALITIPLALILIRLTIAGLISVVGFLFMLVIGLLFLVFWPIPGLLRRLGTQFWVRTFGMQLHALFVTVTVSGVTVVSAIFTTQTGEYGFFVTCVLNLPLFLAAQRTLTWVETFFTIDGTRSNGLVAMIIMRSVTHTASRAVTSVVGRGYRAVTDRGHKLHIGRPSPNSPTWNKGGNWRNARHPHHDPPLERDAEPILAWVMRVPHTGGHSNRGVTGRDRGGLPPSSGTSPASLTGAPSTAGTTTKAPPRPTASTGTGSPGGGRVWIHKQGEGITPPEPWSPPGSSPTGRGTGAGKPPPPKSPPPNPPPPAT